MSQSPQKIRFANLTLKLILWLSFLNVSEGKVRSIPILWPKGVIVIPLEGIMLMYFLTRSVIMYLVET